MTRQINLDVVDRDGAIREVIDEVGGRSRADLLKTAVVGGGVLLVGGVAIRGLPTLVAEAAPSKQGDVAIWNFALTLEYLEAAFYAEAKAKGALTGEAAQFAGIVGAHEQAHVAFLKKALGSSAVKTPKFDFGQTTTDPAMFMATSIALEDTGVAAYNGQGPNLTPAGRGPAAMIVSVEARHAAWIRDIAKKSPAPVGFDEPKTKQQVLAAVNNTGFTA